MDKDQLAALDRAATQELLDDQGYYFRGTFCDLASCSHGETAYFNHQADGPFIAALWNAYRTGKIVLIDDAAVERVARAIHDAADNPLAVFETMREMRVQQARAALAALGVK